MKLKTIFVLLVRVLIRGDGVMMNTKSKHIAALLGSCLLLVVLTIIALNSRAIMPGWFMQEEGVKVTLRDFKKGTNVSYEILAGEQLIERGKQILGDDGVLSLATPKDAVKDNTQKLNYKIHMNMPEESVASAAETLDLFLGIDPETGKISASGSGLDSFSDINVKQGDEYKSVKADWAGLFSAEAINEEVTKGEDSIYHEQVELAFQNAGMSSDFNHLGDGKIEVLGALFGDSSGSNINAVQSRWSWALIKMTEELSAVMVQQTLAVGMFFDAQNQMKIQRKHQELRARAHKDYHPSEQMCRVGTFIRSIAHTETKAEMNKHALNKILMNQYLGIENSSAGRGVSMNEQAEQAHFANYFCDPRDNAGATSRICPPANPSVPLTIAEQERLNKDVDFARTIGGKLTVDVDYTDGPATGTAAHDLVDEEADIIALAKNLYFPNAFEIPDAKSLEINLSPHHNSRTYAAKMNVAHSSFLNLVGMKASAPAGQATTATATTPPVPQQMISPRNPAPPVIAEDAGWNYMKAMLREFGITDENSSGNTDDEINKVLGNRPSYYAQMEVLTKKIYQHPNFYTNLYTKPANVSRIGASIDAITLMNQRDRFESSLRREMLTSLLIEEALARHVDDVSSALYESMQANQERQ